jgi:DNA-binding GntR family transcriptional regulator
VEPPKAGSRSIADELRADIETGAYAVGDRLPSYRALMARFGVAVNTAQAAVQLLEQDGYVTTQDRRGAFVIERPAKRSPDRKLRDLRRELTDLRGQVRQARDAVAQIEQRLAAMVERLGGRE